MLKTNPLALIAIRVHGQYVRGVNGCGSCPALQRVRRTAVAAIVLPIVFLTGCAHAPDPAGVFRELEPLAQTCQQTQSSPVSVEPRKIFVTDGGPIIKGQQTPRDAHDLSQEVVDPGGENDEAIADDVDSSFYAVIVYNIRDESVGSYTNASMGYRTGRPAYRRTVDYCVISWPERQPLQFGTITADPPSSIRSNADAAYGEYSDQLARALKETGYFR